MRLDGKLALVTGAGSGLGAEIAKGLSAAGAEVILADRTAEGLAEVARQIAASGGTARQAVVDVTDRAAIEAIAAGLVQTDGGLDILVNNAGIGGRATLDAPEQPRLWTAQIDVNLQGVYNMAQLLAPLLIARRGTMVNMSSVAGYVAGASSAGYVTSKGAVRSLTQVLARELAPHGVRVNAIAPGIMETPLAHHQLTAPGAADWFLSRAPMARVGAASEIVGPVLFLVSDMSSFVTGVTLPVDGGFLAA